MSYEMFVQGFDSRGAAPMPSSAFEVFRLHVDQTQPEHHLWHVRTLTAARRHLRSRIRVQG